MELSDCIKGYELISISKRKPITKEEVELLWNEFYKNLDGKRFIQACHNVCEVYDYFPGVTEIKREYKDLRPNYEIEKDVKRGVRMPQEMRDLINKIKDKQKESL